MKRLSWEPPQLTPSHVDENVPAGQRTPVPLRRRTRYVPRRRRLRFGLQFDRPPHRPPRSDQGTSIELELIVTAPLRTANDANGDAELDGVGDAESDGDDGGGTDAVAAGRASAGTLPLIPAGQAAGPCSAGLTITASSSEP
jgi:hypothetical protein